MVEAMSRPKDQRRSGPTILTNPPNQEPCRPRPARATQALHRSDSFLGDYFRRMKARMGTPKAMTATAHKLARIIYHMVTTQQPYDTTIFQKQEERRQHQKSARLHAQARELGFQLVPINFVP